MTGSTIAAIATPSGSGGIGIIKISGPLAFPVVLSIFRPYRTVHSSHSSGSLSIDNIISHHFYYGVIVHPDSQSVLDEVLVVFMKTPCTYTREDVVEIQAHSGFAVLNLILKLLLRSGAVLAEPGEFTRRAFMNGRIDLTQAEAVIDLINSRTEDACQAVVSHLSGEFKRLIELYRTRLVKILAEMESSIDFPDDVESFRYAAVIPQIKTDILNPILNLIQQYDDRHYVRDGFHVSIIGLPNVGKSSLMNWLLKKNRSIVTGIPGTTRDVIEESVILNGTQVVFSDTAGIRPTNDPLELLGIEKTYETIHASDLILLVMDSFPLHADLLNQFLNTASRIPVIVVLNKIDLINEYHDIEIIQSELSFPFVAISVKNEMNMDSFVSRITEHIHQKASNNNVTELIPNLRQKCILQKSVDYILSAIDGLQLSNHLDLIAMDIKDSIICLDDISGNNVSDEILDQIFNTFCIGK